MSDRVQCESWKAEATIDVGSTFSLVNTSQEVFTPTLLLMAGFAGAGKTTLASRLHQQLGWVVLNKDDLKLARLAAGVDKKGEPDVWKAFVLQAGREAFDELLGRMQAVLLEGQSVIVDTSNEKPHIFEEIKTIQAQLHALHIRSHLLIVLCIANKDIRTMRLYKRGSVFTPYVDELPLILDDAELPTRFEHFIGDDNVIFVDTNVPVNTYFEDVLHKINAFQAKNDLFEMNGII